MIVCSCNVLTDVAIRTSIATVNGPRRVCDVYASLGCKAKCGGCAVTISALINETEGRGFGAERARQARENPETPCRRCQEDGPSPFSLQSNIEAVVSF
jgi:bacterioferritin-associated ferredoxin